MIKKNLFHNLISISQKSEGIFRTCVAGVRSAVPGNSHQIKQQLFWAVSFILVVFQASEVDTFLKFRSINPGTLDIVFNTGENARSVCWNSALPNLSVCSIFLCMIWEHWTSAWKQELWWSDYTRIRKGTFIIRLKASNSDNSCLVSPEKGMRYPNISQSRVNLSQ